MVDYTDFSPSERVSRLPSSDDSTTSTDDSGRPVSEDTRTEFEKIVDEIQSEDRKVSRLPDDDDDDDDDSGGGGSSRRRSSRSSRRSSRTTKKSDSKEEPEPEKTASTRKEPRDTRTARQKFVQEEFSGLQSTPVSKKSKLEKESGITQFYKGGELLAQFTPGGKRLITTGTFFDPTTGQRQRITGDETQRQVSAITRQARQEREAVEKKRRQEAIETSPFRTGILGQSVDPSQLKDRRERLVRSESGEVAGIRSDILRQSIQGDFSEQAFLQQKASAQLSRSQRQREIERAREKADRDSQPILSLGNLARADFNLQGQTTMQSRQKLPAVEKPRFQKTLSKQEELPFIESLSRGLTRERGRLKTSRRREGLSIGESATAVGLGIGSVLVGTAVLGKELLKKPVQTSLAAGTGLFKIATGQQQLTSVGRALREEPQFATGVILGEVATGRGVSSISRTAREAADIGASFARGGFKPIRQGALRVDDEAIRIVGGVDTTSESLARQASRAGQEVFPVSAQRSLFSPTRQRRIIIDKPKPTPQASELERLFFADPEGRLRTSRLSTKRVASQEDFFDRLAQQVSEPITFTREKPQVAFFQRQRLREFPSNLREVESGFLSGRIRSAADLTQTQRQAFTQFLFERTGRFSPVVFVSRESEIAAAVGDVLVPRRKGFTLVPNLEGGGLIRRRATSIFETTLQRADDVDGAIARGADTTSDIRKLSESSAFKGLRERSLSPTLSKSLRISTSPSARPSRKSTSSISATSQLSRSSITPSTSFSPSAPSRVSTSPISSQPVSPSTLGTSSLLSTSTSAPSGVSTSPSSAQIGSPIATGGSGASGSVTRPSRTARTPPFRTRDKPSRDRQKVQAYNAYAFQEGEKVQVNTRPLTREAALNSAWSAVDNTASATGFIKKAGKKKVVDQGIKVNKALREKFSKGQKKRKNQPVKWTEKNENRIDTFGELQGITAKGLASRKKSLSRLGL